MAVIGERFTGRHQVNCTEQCINVHEMHYRHLHFTCCFPHCTKTEHFEPRRASKQDRFVVVARDNLSACLASTARFV